MSKKVLFKVIKINEDWTYQCEEVETGEVVNLKKSYKLKETKLEVGKKYHFLVNENWINVIEPYASEEPLEEIDMTEPEPEPVKTVSKSKSETNLPFEVPDLSNPHDRQAFGLMKGNANATAATLLQGKPVDMDEFFRIRNELIKNDLENFWR